jgi:hypothetical protein
MSRDGNGTYTAPINSWNPAINGVLASSGDWQNLLNDIVAALTQSVSRDGQTPMTGELKMGGHKISGLEPGTGTGQALAFQQLFNQGTMADIASAATTDIGIQNTNFLRVTGNTTITSLGTNYRGPRFLVFAGAVMLTNSSSLVLPGGVNLTTKAGDVLICIPGATLGTSGRWIVSAFTSGGGISVNVISSNTTAVSGALYVLASSLTLSLPANQGAGATVSFSNRSGTSTPVIARNGQNIMGLAEDMTLDNINHFGTLVFSDATRGWIFQ